MRDSSGIVLETSDTKVINKRVSIRTTKKRQKPYKLRFPTFLLAFLANSHVVMQ